MIRKFFAVGIALCMFVSTSLPLFAESDKATMNYRQGYDDAARFHHGTKYFTWTLAGGVLISPLLTYIITGISAAGSNPEPRMDQVSMELLQDYTYMKGYREKARKKNSNNALFGFLAAVAINVAILSSIQQSN